MVLRRVDNRFFRLEFIGLSTLTSADRMLMLCFASLLPESPAVATSFADGNDAQSWYLLGRAYIMAVTKYQKAYEAYQQTVYRDGRDPTFWCSIGILYSQINRYRDALDSYSRAIRINPYISYQKFGLTSALSTSRAIIRLPMPLMHMVVPLIWTRLIP